MSGKFHVKVSIEISAAHALRGYQGDCARVHGHNWTVEAEICCLRLNDIGIAIDFKEVKRALKEITGPYDHQFMNEIAPFDEINPTAENIAAWIYEQLAEQINNKHTKLYAITLWETNRSSVRYMDYD